jgi:hypothetical protein
VNYSNPQKLVDKTARGAQHKVGSAFPGMEKFLQSLLGPKRELVDVKSGDRFCRHRRDKVMELATVTDLRPDPLGIPHVHFKLTFEKPAIGQVEGGKRVLALDSFIEAYRQRVA